MDFQPSIPKRTAPLHVDITGLDIAMLTTYTNTSKVLITLKEMSSLNISFNKWVKKYDVSESLAIKLIDLFSPTMRQVTISNSLRNFILQDLNPNDEFWYDCNKIMIIKSISTECFNPNYIQKLKLTDVISFIRKAELNNKVKYSGKEVQRLSNGLYQTDVPYHAMVVSAFSHLARERAFAKSFHARKIDNNYLKAAVRLIDVSNKILDGFKTLVDRLPNQDQINAMYRHGATVKFTPDHLLESYSYIPKFKIKEFMENSRDQNESVCLIKQSLIENKKVIVKSKSGENLNFFISSSGSLCLSSSARFGVKYSISNKSIASVSIFEAKSEKDNLLSGLKRGTELTNKYIDQVNKERLFTNSFIRDCLNANPWYSPCRNKLSTGCSIDGKLISLKRILSYIPSCELQRVTECITDQTPLLLIFPWTKGREARLFFSKDDQSGDWSAVFSNVGINGGTEYSYLMINSTSFIGYDVD